MRPLQVNSQQFRQRTTCADAASRARTRIVLGLAIGLAQA
jgi:hypothetical protein